jgi:hypothetical protein
VEGNVVDNTRLEQVLTDGRNRTFWVKPYGLPGSHATGHECFDADRLRIDFSLRPRAVSVGDVLLVYRIGDSQLIYVAECRSSFQEATPDEIAQNPNFGRWRWHVEGRNLTPEFGREWASHDLRPFRLVEEYNVLHPAEPENLDGLMFGRDKLRVSRAFAEFVSNRIMTLPSTAGASAL